MSEKYEKAITDLYMGIHVSQLKELPECVENVWKLGQKIYDDKRSGSLHPVIQRHEQAKNKRK